MRLCRVMSFCLEAVDGASSGERAKEEGSLKVRAECFHDGFGSADC